MAAAKFREDASYLIVGGLGGIGRVICRWMVGLKAKHIILLSRSGLQSDSSRHLAQELRKDGAHLLALQCDVSDRHQLEQALELCDMNMPPITGVVQAAMLLKVRIF